MIKKEFVTELSFLEKVEELEVVEITQLANHLGMKYDAVAKRLYRYTKSGLVEPMVIERGKYCLGNKAYIWLDYLRKERGK
jgi:hypothetical protein